MTKVDLVCKSYGKDYPWLSFALKSVQKFCTGFNQIMVLLPRSEPLNLTAETVVYLDTQESYLHAQVAKLNADLHTEADYLVYFDSDMVFTRPINPRFFFREGKPIWVMSPWDSLYKGGEKKAWYHVMAKCLQEAPPYEFMRKCAVIVPRHVLQGFRDFIQRTHGCSMDHYVVSQPGNEFSEYNCLGFYCWLFHRDEFYWHDTSKEGVPVWPFKQFWSWGGLTPEIRTELENITGPSMHIANDITSLTNRRNIGDWLNVSGLTGEGVEIGVQDGINAADIIASWRGTLHLVDPWKKQPDELYRDGTNLIDFEKAYEETLRRVKPYPNHVVCRMNSDEAFEHYRKQGKRFDFIHIDGNHSSPQVDRDLEQWWTLMRHGGVFSGHDFLDLDAPEWKCDVKTAVNAFAVRHSLKMHITQDAGGWPAWWTIKT